MTSPQPAALSDALKALLEQASAWSRQNQPERAADCWRRVLEQSPDVAPALSGLGSYYLSRGELGEAQRLLLRAATVSDQPAMAYANLSRVHSARGDLPQALEAIKQAIQAEPAAWGAHAEKARLLQQLGREREAATAWSAAMAYMPPAFTQAPHMQALVNEAKAAIAANQAQLREFMLDHLHGALEGGSRRELERFDHCLDILTGRRTFVTARPLMLPFPRLPAIPFFHREDYDWVPGLEAAFPDILAELETLLAQQRAFEPYVQTPAGEPMGSSPPSTASWTGAPTSCGGTASASIIRRTCACAPRRPCSRMRPSTGCPTAPRWRSSRRSSQAPTSLPTMAPPIRG